MPSEEHSVSLTESDKRKLIRSLRKHDVSETEIMRVMEQLKGGILRVGFSSLRPELKLRKGTKGFGFLNLSKSAGATRGRVSLGARKRRDRPRRFFIGEKLEEAVKSTERERSLRHHIIDPASSKVDQIGVSPKISRFVDLFNSDEMSLAWNLTTRKFEIVVRRRLPTIKTRIQKSRSDTADRFLTALGKRSWLLDYRRSGFFRVSATYPPQFFNPGLPQQIVNGELAITFMITPYVTKDERDISKLTALILYPSGAVRGLSAEFKYAPPTVTMTLVNPLALIDPAFDSPEIPTESIEGHADVVLVKKAVEE